MWFGGSAPPLRPPPPPQQQQQQYPTPPSARPSSDDDLDNNILSGMSDSGNSDIDDRMQDDERELQPQEAIVPHPMIQRAPGTTDDDIAPASLGSCDMPPSSERSTTDHRQESLWYWRMFSVELCVPFRTPASTILTWRSSPPHGSRSSTTVKIVQAAVGSHAVQVV